MNRLLALIALLTLTLAIGFGAGYHVKSNAVLAGQTKQAQQASQETADRIVTAIETSQKVETAVTAADTQITQIKQAVAKRPLVKPQPKLEKPHEQTTTPAADHAPDRLDACTVRLLNAAREGRSVESAGCGDGQGQAATQAAGR